MDDQNPSLLISDERQKLDDHRQRNRSNGALSIESEVFFPTPFPNNTNNEKSRRNFQQQKPPTSHKRHNIDQSTIVKPSSEKRSGETRGNPQNALDYTPTEERRRNTSFNPRVKEPFQRENLSHKEHQDRTFSSASSKAHYNKKQENASFDQSRSRENDSEYRRSERNPSSNPERPQSYQKTRTTYVLSPQEQKRNEVLKQLPKETSLADLFYGEILSSENRDECGQFIYYGNTRPGIISSVQTFPLYLDPLTKKWFVLGLIEENEISSHYISSIVRQHSFILDPMNHKLTGCTKEILESYVDAHVPKLGAEDDEGTMQLSSRAGEIPPSLAYQNGELLSLCFSCFGGSISKFNKPRGGALPDKSIYDALCREIQEETQNVLSFQDLYPEKREDRLEYFALGEYCLNHFCVVKPEALDNFKRLIKTTNYEKTIRRLERRKYGHQFKSTSKSLQNNLCVFRSKLCDDESYYVERLYNIESTIEKMTRNMYAEDKQSVNITTVATERYREAKKEVMRCTDALNAIGVAVTPQWSVPPLYSLCVEHFLTNCSDICCPKSHDSVQTISDGAKLYAKYAAVYQIAKSRIEAENQTEDEQKKEGRDDMDTLTKSLDSLTLNSNIHDIAEVDIKAMVTAMKTPTGAPHPDDLPMLFSANIDNMNIFAAFSLDTLYGPTRSKMFQEPIVISQWNKSITDTTISPIALTSIYHDEDMPQMARNMYDLICTSPLVWSEKFDFAALNTYPKISSWYYTPNNNVFCQAIQNHQGKLQKAKHRQKDRRYNYNAMLPSCNEISSSLKSLLTASDKIEFIQKEKNQKQDLKDVINHLVEKRNLDHLHLKKLGDFVYKIAKARGKGTQG